ncbi:MAG: hypothetical protein ACRYGF_10755 [Janthinobacterium lividum]
MMVEPAEKQVIEICVTGGDMLIKALDDHMETLKTTRALVQENERLKTELAALRAKQAKRCGCTN